MGFHINRQLQYDAAEDGWLVYNTDLSIEEICFRTKK